MALASATRKNRVTLGLVMHANCPPALVQMATATAVASAILPRKVALAAHSTWVQTVPRSDVQATRFVVAVVFAQRRLAAACASPIRLESRVSCPAFTEPSWTSKRAVCASLATQA
jgi:hypothetical protein